MESNHIECWADFDKKNAKDKAAKKTKAAAAPSTKKQQSPSKKQPQVSGGWVPPAVVYTSARLSENKPPTPTPSPATTTPSPATVTITIAKQQPPTPAPQPSTPKTKPIKASKREVVYQGITLFDQEDKVLFDQQKEELTMFFKHLGDVETVDAKWSEGQCSVVYVSIADAKAAVSLFKAVSKVEDALEELLQRHQPTRKFYINLKNVWNIKATMAKSLSGSNKPAATVAHPPTYAHSQQRPQHHHLNHTRSSREWRPTGFSRSQQQQSPLPTV
eukprot:gene8441-9928_t